MILETSRLILRKLQQSDFLDLCKILQDETVMRAYEGAFNHEEVQQWLDKQLKRYHDDGYGLWAVIQKDSQVMIGQCGLTVQDWKGRQLLEIGYLFRKDYWHNGYATEAANGCKKYAFDILKAPEVCSIIRDTNIQSQKVALRNGMQIVDTTVRHYRNVEMPHFLFTVANDCN